MHILLGVLAVLVTVLILLKRLADDGIALGGLNPFAPRVRTVTRTVDHPIYRLRTPVDAAGVLLVGVAKADGDMTAEDKELLVTLFQSELKLENDVSVSLLRRSAELFDEVALKENLQEVLEPVIRELTVEQKNSLLAMMEEVATVRGKPSAAKLELVTATKAEFDVLQAGRESPWSE